MSKTPISVIRDSYINSILDVETVHKDPVLQFQIWYNDAMDSEIPDMEAMFLSTVSENGFPSGRMVLMKGFDLNGFVFFTNYNSRKGSEILLNPNVAIVFYWKEINRQVRITGKAVKVSAAESDEYFLSRPLESRISAIISRQSQVIPGREAMESKFDAMKLNLSQKEPERPGNWGGFRITPVTFEFWQSRPHRLHDRIQYRLAEDTWIIERLSP